MGMFSHDSTSSKVMFIVGIVSLVPALLDFLPMTIKVADAPELDGVVPGPIYPLFGVLTAALAIGGGFMGPGAPGASCCAAGKGLMISALVLGVIQLIMVAWFGFIGVVLATVCEEIDNAENGIENCEYTCLQGGNHDPSKCTSPDGYGGTDCCASLSWGEPKTCAPGYSVGTAEVSDAERKHDEALTEFCDMMGLMTLTAIARFALVLTLTICACCSVCCGPSAPAAVAGGVQVVVQQPQGVQPAVVVQQPGVVQAQPAPGYAPQQQKP